MVEPRSFWWQRSLGASLADADLYRWPTGMRIGGAYQLVKPEHQRANWNGTGCVVSYYLTEDHLNGLLADCG